jgi:phage shock protein E
VPTTIDRNMVQRLVADGAQLVEVLPPNEYEEEHLPGAVSLPLRQLTPETAGTLRKNIPVITYCWDFT